MGVFDQTRAPMLDHLVLVLLKRRCCMLSLSAFVPASIPYSCIPSWYGLAKAAEKHALSSCDAKAAAWKSKPQWHWVVLVSRQALQAAL
eukprot:scaffold177980_cov18-Tisochrysis_lutea.AAC.3